MPTIARHSLKRIEETGPVVVGLCELNVNRKDPNNGPRMKVGPTWSASTVGKGVQSAVERYPCVKALQSEPAIIDLHHIISHAISAFIRYN